MREFGLIGRSLKHSFSQTYFSQKFHNLGLADCRYELFELPTINELPQLLAQHPRLAGLNVTIPYKEQVWPYLDGTALSADRVGAVNVIEFTADGRRVGHNTDIIGFRESLLRFFPGIGPEVRALVLGTGGAAKAVEVVLRDLGVGYWLVSRNPLGPGLTYDDLTPRLLAEHPLLINATPLGTYPKTDECPPIPYPALTPRHYLFDLTYNPAETLFMQKGAAAGAQVQNGFDMLCRQAEAAWEIWQR